VIFYKYMTIKNGSIYLNIGVLEHLEFCVRYIILNFFFLKLYTSHSYTRCGKLTSFFELSGQKRRGAPGGWAWSHSRGDPKVM
jgi:hypothetical protein